MIRSKGSKLVPLTRELAEKIATMPRWSGERDLRPKRVTELLEKIEAGLFHSPEWATARMGAEEYRMNGQHSSLALTQSNGSFPAGMMVTIKEFEVDNQTDLGLLFAQFDTGGRSSKDITSAGTIDLNDIHAQLRSKIVSGMFHAINDFRNWADSSAEVRVKAIHSDHEFARWAASNLSPKHVCRVPVFAASFLMWRANREACKEFWRLVVSEEHPQVNNPTRTAARELRESRNSKGGITQVRECAARCIQLWNAWRDGRALSSTRFNGTIQPVRK